MEHGIIVGTSGGKYDNNNPLARYLISRFDRAICELAAHVSPGNVLEIGAGEGHVTNLLLESTGARIVATDISETVLAQAERNLGSGRVTYRAVDLMAMAPLRPRPEMVVCCEVLEHLSDPRQGLTALLAQAADWYLLSVPREPVWRVLNMARGAYWRDLGNSPGHLQHWSQQQFLRLVGQYFQPIAVRSPLPWTVVLCRPKRGRNTAL